MPREIVEIPLCMLTISPLNVRRNGARDVASLARSIESHGLYYPLLIRPLDKTRYEIVAGRRRFMALTRIKAKLAPCLVLDAGDDAAAIEASLIENTERVDMDELDAYEAFAKLLAEGREVADIAFTFSLPAAAVRQRLALANLIPDAKRRYRQGELDAKTIRIMTLGSKERQRGYLRLLDDPDQQEPPPWQLKQFMLGGASIEAKAALFPLDAYTAPITSDLFNETQYLTDADLFWQLQRAEIDKITAELAAKGWQTITVLDPDQPFYPYQYEPATKAQGGHVVIKLNGDGHVQIEKGLIPQAERRAHNKREQREAAASNGAGSDPTLTGAADGTLPEMTANLTNYVELVRHSTVAAALLKKPKIALRVMVAQLIAGSAHVHAARDPRTPATPQIASSVSAMDSETSQHSARADVLGLLGMDANGGLLDAAASGHGAADVLDKLLALTDAQVLTILAVITSETLHIGSPLIDKLGVTLAADVARHWQPDNTLFLLARGKRVIEGMAEEVLGSDAPAALTGTQMRAKSIIAQAVKAKGWTPRWLQFPAGRYHDTPQAKPKPAARSPEPMMEAAE